METEADKTPHDWNSFDHQIQRPDLRKRLINLARRKDIPEADCEDVASDIIAEAIRCQAGYHPQRGSVATWTLAIGENVIGSHIRRLNAQKRKPEGGIISFDAPTDADANPLEVRDTRAEAERKSAQVAEHFLDVAKLSDKEAAAIGSQRNKQIQTADRTGNYLAGRRAMKKLKQVATDEKFQERPQGPEAAECAYGNIATAEHDTALLYDGTRRIPWFIDAIKTWRDSPEWKQMRAFLDHERTAKRFPLAIPAESWPELFAHYREAARNRDPVLRRRFEAAVEITVAFSEWPTVGYCRLEPNERRRVLEQFGWQFGSEPFWEINHREFEIVVSAADHVPDPKCGLTPFLKSINQASQNASDVSSSAHLVRIDRQYPRKTIVDSFCKWLDAQPKPCSETIVQAGRRRTTRLVGFAAIRLVDDFGLTTPQAISWLKARFGGPVPSTPARFERAAQEVRAGLKDFLPSPAEMKL
jgi:DNA-directed RNA polymerase specialized sigma24 family protein